MNLEENKNLLNIAGDHPEIIPIESYILTAKTRHVLTSPEINSLNLQGFEPARCPTETAYRQCLMWVLRNGKRYVAPTMYSVAKESYDKAVENPSQVEEIKTELPSSQEGMSCPIIRREVRKLVGNMKGTDESDKDLSFSSSGDRNFDWQNRSELSAGYYRYDLPYDKVSTVDEANEIVSICKKYGYSAVRMNKLQKELVLEVVSKDISVYSPEAPMAQISDMPGIWSNGFLNSFVWKGFSPSVPTVHNNIAWYHMPKSEERYPFFGYSYLPKRHLEGIVYLPCKNVSSGLCLATNTPLPFECGLKAMMTRFRSRYSVRERCKLISVHSSDDKNKDVQNNKRKVKRKKKSFPLYSKNGVRNKTDNSPFGKVHTAFDKELAQVKSIEKLINWVRSCGLEDLARCVVCLVFNTRPPDLIGFTECYDKLNPFIVLMILREVGGARCDRLEKYFDFVDKEEIEMVFHSFSKIFADSYLEDSTQLDRDQTDQLRRESLQEESSFST